MKNQTIILFIYFSNFIQLLLLIKQKKIHSKLIIKNIKHKQLEI